MKKLIIYSLFFTLFSANTYSQEQTSHGSKKRELSLETNSGKLFQGAVTGAMTYYTVQQFSTLKEEWRWLKVPISVLTSYLFEVFANKSKTTTEKQLSVATGALTVTVTIELFKNRR